MPNYAGRIASSAGSKRRGYVVQIRALSVALLVIFVVAGCGGGDDPSPEEAMADLCAATSDFQASVQDLGAVLTNPDSTVEELREAREDARDELEDVRDRAEDVDEAEIDALSDAYDELDQVVDDVADDATLAEAAEMIAPLVQAVNGSWDQLLTGLTCS